MVTAGFASRGLARYIQSSVSFRRDLEAVCAFISDGSVKVALVSLDLIELPHPVNRALQERICCLTGFPADNILLHTTHTHASPWDEREENCLTGIADVIAEAILQAKANAVPVTVRTGEKDVGKSLSIQRFGYAGDDLGYQTYWYGYQYREGKTSPDASALVNEMKSRWKGSEPEYKPGDSPVWFDRPVDPLVQTISFEDADCNSVGTIVRFSTHIGPADTCKDRMYDPDFPAVMRDVVRERTNAPAMYLSGPLGNLGPKVDIEYVMDKDRKLPASYLGPTWALVAKDEEQALSERDRLGREIAQAALESVRREVHEQITSLQFKTVMHDLPLAPDLPRSEKEADLIKGFLLPEYQAARQREGSYQELRLLANRLNRLEWTRQFIGLISDEDRNAGFTKLPLSVLQINNTVLAFTHSETCVETSLKLREAFPSVNLVTVCLTGGTVQYVPPAELMDLGGYEGRISPAARNAEEKLREEITDMINDVTGG